MGDEDRSFISLKEKKSEEGDDESTRDDDDEDKRNSPQNNTEKPGGSDDDIVGGSRPDTEDQPEETTMSPASPTHIAVPVSLIIAGNLLVVAVIALFEPTKLLWLFAMIFASVEVLVGAAIWYFS